MVGTIIGTLMVRPDFGKALVGSLRFGYLPEFPEWAPKDAVENPLLTMATAFGYVGGSVMGYVVYANWVSMHRWGMTGHRNIEAIRQRATNRDKIDYLPEKSEQVSQLRQILAPLRWDIGMGAIVLFIVTGAFMISGAAVLYGMQSTFEGWSLLTDQASVWKNIHASLVWVYYICIVVALWGTLQALPEIYARVMQEFFQAIWPQREWNYDTLRRWICLYIFLTTMVLIWSNIPFDILTQIAGFILANFSIALMMLRGTISQREVAHCLPDASVHVHWCSDFRGCTYYICRDKRLGLVRQTRQASHVVVLIKVDTFPLKL